MIKITADSTCDLPSALLETHHISIAPLGVVKGGKLYRDGVNIRTADIAAHVAAGGELTTTNAVNAADYEDLFRRAGENCDAVIHVDIGSGFSSCYQNARLAAKLTGWKIDIKSLSQMNEALAKQAEEAAQAEAEKPEAAEGEQENA